MCFVSANPAACASIVYSPGLRPGISNRLVGPVFAVDSPDLVFGYYLNRSVIPLKYFRHFEDTPGPAYLITSEQVANSAPPSLTRVAVARVNGRPFVLLRKS